MHLLQDHTKDRTKSSLPFNKSLLEHGWKDKQEKVVDPCLESGSPKSAVSFVDLGARTQSCHALDLARSDREHGPKHKDC